MAYITKDDFRTNTLAEYCQGLALTTNEASDANLTAAITRLSQRLDDFTDDHFESENLTLSTQGDGINAILTLPKRCTAMTQVRIQDDAATYTVQTGYIRLHSSLYSSGSKRIGDMDWLEVVAGGGGLTGLPSSAWDPYAWPSDTNSVEITGTFGWTTTPGDIKRAVALMVWDHFKSQRGDLRTAQRHSSGDVTIELAEIGPDAPTGIPEVDRIILGYQRDSYLGVG